MRAKYDSLYKDVIVNRENGQVKGFLPLLFTTSHCLRRIIIPVVVVFLASMYNKVIILAVMTQIQLLWLMIIKPMERDSVNVLHVFNEFSFLLLVYLVIGFSDASPDNNSIYELGYFYLAVIALVVLLNMLILISTVIGSIIAKLRDKKKKKN